MLKTKGMRISKDLKWISGNEMVAYVYRLRFYDEYQ